MNILIATLKQSVAVLAGAVVVSLGLSSAALAVPQQSGACASCHTAPLHAVEITGFSGVANPAGGIGMLKYFNAIAGTTVQLKVNVVGGAEPTFALALVDTFANPVLSLAQAAGAGWAYSATAPSHFYIGPTPDLGTYSFNFAVPAATPAGYYAFTFTAGGYSPTVVWADSENFYVRVLAAVPEVGTLSLMALGLAAIGVVARLRQKRLPR